METLAREAARAAELEQFAFVASHDLQEPLRKIRFFGERLRAQFSQSFSDEEVDSAHSQPGQGAVFVIRLPLKNIVEAPEE